MIDARIDGFTEVTIGRSERLDNPDDPLGGAETDWLGAAAVPGKGGLQYCQGNPPLAERVFK